jgi:hypothetical protein
MTYVYRPSHPLVILEYQTYNKLTACHEGFHPLYVSIDIQD